jgi:ABC-type transporter Mla subunit MlaD
MQELHSAAERIVHALNITKDTLTEQKEQLKRTAQTLEAIKSEVKDAKDQVKTSGKDVILSLFHRTKSSHSTRTPS